MKEARKIAYCGMTAALSIVMMVIGSIAGLGMYAAPMFAGLLVAPIGQQLGRKYHVLIWLVVSMLSFMLIANPEQNLMYLCLFGCYPIIWPLFMRIKSPKMQLLAKLAFFNVVVIALEALIVLVLVPEVMTAAMAVILILLGNIMFVMYDFMVPRADVLVKKLLGRIKKK